ncbi:MAG: ribonuclease PH [Candidatus Lernaella stagnicola]|nr:ribonuclease PH [Candidatus Lernaella stagnicola]
MRLDRRRANEMRPVKFTRGVSDHAEGSCLVEFGLTHVRCTATVNEHLPRWRKAEDGGWVTGEYDMLPRAGHERSPRTGGRGGRAQEISRLVGRSFRAVTDLSKLPGVTIVIDCDVLQADGGTRTAAISGGYIALIDALRYCREKNLIQQMPLRDSVAAVSVGLVDGKAYLDLCYEEDFSATLDANFVITGRGDLVEIQMTGEEATFTEEDLHQLLGLAKRGVRKLTRLQRVATGPVRFLRSGG